VVIVYQFKGTIHSLSIDDIHLVSWHELIFAMMVLAPTLQVFRPIKPTDSNVYMLLVKCTHLQDLRFPVRETVKDWVFGYTVAMLSDPTTLAIRQYSPVTIRATKIVALLTSKAIVSSQTFPTLPRLHRVLYSQSFFKQIFLYLHQFTAPFPLRRPQYRVHAKWLVRRIKAVEQAHAVLV
jgi:hypothetical protein